MISRGIVLNEIKFQETSKIVNIYTENLGKINVMAKGAFRPKSKLMSSTQPFVYSEFELKKGRNWYYIDEASIIDSFYPIRENVERMVYGCYMLELVNKSVPEEEKNELAFKLLEKSLYVLSNLDDGFLKFIIAFELKYISFIGYRPNLDECAECGKEVLDRVRFSIAKGGLICSECNYLDNRSIFIDSEIYKAMITLMYIKLEDISKVEIDKNLLIKVQNILEMYILHVLDRPMFNSLNILRSMLVM